MATKNSAAKSKAPSRTVSAKRSRASKAKTATKPNLMQHSSAADVPLPPKLSNVFRLLLNALKFLRDNWKLFGGITLVYAVLALFFVRGIASSIDINTVKNGLQQVATGPGAEFIASVTLFNVLLGSSTGVSQTGGVYQAFFVTVTSLALIWALRQVHAGNPRVTTKQAYYSGMFPLVQFVLVICAIGIQLLPLVIASTLYNMVTKAGLAVHWYEYAIWIAIFSSGALVSLYMISASALALYIVTLPDTTPMVALRSARHIARGYRWALLRKLLFLPIFVVLFNAVILIPLILYTAPLAEWVFFTISVLTLPLIHTYMYMLYRELV